MSRAQNQIFYIFFSQWASVQKATKFLMQPHENLPIYILTSSIFEPDGHGERPREGGHDGRHNPIRGPNNDPYKVKVSFAINNK